MRRAFRVIAWVISPISLYLFVAVVGALVPASRDDAGPQAADAWIILAQGPIHYDILLPLDDTTRAGFAFVKGAGVPIDHFNAAWLSVGWGSEAFYTTTGHYTDLSTRTVIKAATGDSAVIRFEAYGQLPDLPSLRRVPVSATQLDVLRDAIRADLPDAPAALPMAGFSETDAFFPANGHFSILRTCNVWVGDKLAQAGLDFGIWTPTPYAVTLSLWWNGLQPD